MIQPMNTVKCLQHTIKLNMTFDFILQFKIKLISILNFVFSVLKLKWSYL